MLTVEWRYKISARINLPKYFSSLVIYDVLINICETALSLAEHVNAVLSSKQRPENVRPGSLSQNAGGFQIVVLQTTARKDRKFRSALSLFCSLHPWFRTISLSREVREAFASGSCFSSTSLVFLKNPACLYNSTMHSTRFLFLY